MAVFVDPRARYTSVAIALHWIITVLIVLQFVFAWTSEDLPKAQQMQVMGWHMANGLLILALSIFRVIWRVANPAPSFVKTLRPWESRLASIVHGLFYFLIVAIPLFGWSMVSGSPRGGPVSFFGLFYVPRLPLPQAKPIHENFAMLHEAFAWALLALLALHVLAALKHQFLDRDGTMRRILWAMR
jgi:cytochrome b561